MMELTSKQRAYLKSLAQKIDPIFQLGKNGLTPEVTEAVGQALDARELIKIKILENCPTSVKDTAILISEQIGADIVQTIGMKIVLFKQSSKEQNRKIDLKKIK